jgi:hypothetical protein
MTKRADITKVLLPVPAGGLVLLCLSMAALAGARGIIDTTSSPYAKLRSVDFDSVRWTEGFWAKRFGQCKEVTLPHLYKLAAHPNYGHALTNLRIAAGLEEGEFAGTHWQDAWVYKWLEAAAVVYGVTKDARLGKLMDQAIDVIAKAEQDDGYIASQITVRGWKRFQNPHHHECYTMGHLITAACIHHRISGKTNFLDVARRTADYLYEQFKGKNERLAHFPRNPSVVMAAVELYRTTGQQKYLELANTVIDMRGAFPKGSDLNQDRFPLRKEHEVVGHAVFYTYLYAGAADAYMETGDRTLLAALNRLWDDLVEHKMYITGGCCALHRGLSIRTGKMWSADDVHEAAGPPYHLPNATAYNETCAQVGNFMWNWRMLAITGQARFADIMEREMYNGFLSGISLDGKRFFYSNPLRWYGREHVLLSNDTLLRHEIGKSNRICCPTNVLRTLAEMHGYFYSVSDKGLWVHHYGGSIFDNGEFKLRQETDYPWHGTVRFSVEEAPQDATIHLRIPAWAESAKLLVDGEVVRCDVQPGTYASVTHEWSSGDEITLQLPMEVRLLIAHPKVEEARNQVAIMRGPIVYCLESVDLPEEVKISDVVIPRDITLGPRFEEQFLGGIAVLQGQARVFNEGDWSNQLYRELTSKKPKEVSVQLIPYYAWANRGVSEMTVWLPLGR